MTSSKELAVSERERTVSERPNRCIVGGCINTPHIEDGIPLHSIPFTGDVRLQARHNCILIRRSKINKWIDFVKLKRCKVEAKQELCS